MHLIDPICEANCKPHIGKPVCVVLVDGTTIYATLGGLNDDKLILKSGLGGEGETVVTNQAGKKGKKNGKKAKTTALGRPPYPYPYPPYPYPGELVLDLALIALLFAIPLVWI